jgi:hypothetical protein
MQTSTSRWSGIQNAGIPLITVGYLVVIALNLWTLQLGPATVVYDLSLLPYGGLLSIIVFDSWGTVGGLLGVILFYGVVVYGTVEKRRLEVSLYLLFSTILLATVAGLIYDRFFDNTKFLGTVLIAAGASTVAEAGLAAVIVLLLAAILRIFSRWRSGEKASLIVKKWAYLDISFLLLALTFIFVSQPFYIPTIAYNWRGHELAFALGVTATVFYVAIRRNGQIWENQKGLARARYGQKNS